MADKAVWSVPVSVDDIPESGRHFELKPDETIVFSWIVYKSKAHRKQVNAKVMSDPRIAAMMPDKTEQPFDPKRMLYGGFKMIVDL